MKRAFAGVVLVAFIPMTVDAQGSTGRASGRRPGRVVEAVASIHANGTYPTSQQEGRVLRVPEISSRDNTTAAAGDRDLVKTESAPVVKSVGVGTQATYAVYSPGGKLVAEYDEDGVCSREYIYTGDALLAEYRPDAGEYYYYLSDQVRSTRLVSDGSGTVVHAAAYGPFGEELNTWADTYDPKLGFSGKEREESTGQDYFEARYYGIDLARFISIDPKMISADRLFNIQKHNLYSYVINNPLTYYDSDGRDLTIIFDHRGSGLSFSEATSFVRRAASKFEKLGVKTHILFIKQPKRKQRSEHDGCVYVSFTKNDLRGQLGRTPLFSDRSEISTAHEDPTWNSSERRNFYGNVIAHEMGHATNIFKEYSLDGLTKSIAEVGSVMETYVTSKSKLASAPRYFSNRDAFKIKKAYIAKD